MKQKILIVLVGFLTIFKICQTMELIYQDQHNFYENQLTSVDYTGNFSEFQISNIKGFIQQAQCQYHPTQLSIATYIAQTMSKINKDYNFSVYVFDKTTISATVYLDQDLGKHLWWIRYGQYNLSYVIDLRAACKNMGTSNVSEPFGQQVAKEDQDFITQVVKNSAVYRSDSVIDAAEYIYTKISQKYGRFYKVVIAKPNSYLAFYECRTGEFWAYFKNFTDRKWSYYIVRTQKV